ncbi:MULTISPECIES: hypothetical protein [Pseudoalteromonas]|uniref:hypothetical protein n=1 Tax=Pseudoalteromonas TaxID=53246 RepID=UPI001980E732|nr:MULTISPECIES: hypothetical protein [Pseudoalteromonas]
MMVPVDDMFDGVYHMDPDDLDDMHCEVAARPGISKENAEAIVYYDKAETVKELVSFLNGHAKIIYV